MDNFKPYPHGSIRMFAPANLLAMPVVAPITVLGLLSAGIAPLCLPVATALAHAAAWPAGWIALVADKASGLPMARLPWPEGGWGVVACCGWRSR